MTFLLDTHVWIWSQETPDELGEQARTALVDPGNSLYVATISTLEIARLVEMGLVELSGRVVSWIEESLGLLQCGTIELSHEIAVAAYSLPSPFHKDPADRVLVATARELDLKFVTADNRILAYPHVRTQDARR